MRKGRTVRAEQEREEVMHSDGGSAMRGKLQVPRKNKYRTLGFIPFVKFTGRGSTVGRTTSEHTCTYTQVCNHRHIIPQRYTTKPANIIDRLQSGEKSKSSSPCRGRP